MKDERKQWVIEMAGLGEHRGRPTALLSGGWKQRLALGCAILHQPPIVFLDEPTSGVDPISRRAFWDLIYEMSAKESRFSLPRTTWTRPNIAIGWGLSIGESWWRWARRSSLNTSTWRKRCWRCFAYRPETAMGEIEQLPAVKRSGAFWPWAARGGRRRGGGRSVDPQMLEERGYGIERVEKITPSLEDVFVSLIEARDRAEGVQEEVRDESDEWPKGDSSIFADHRWDVPAKIGTVPAGGGAGMRLMRIWAVARKEFLHVLRDARAWGWRLRYR